MSGNEFALEMQCGYKQGYEEGAIAELKKLKEKLDEEDCELICLYEEDYMYSAGLQRAIELIDNRIEELEG